MGLSSAPNRGRLSIAQTSSDLAAIWYMLYVVNANSVGYETHLAQSDNLLDWKPLGKVLSLRQGGWDKNQADGSMALIDPAWGGSYQPQTFDGKYWMSYIGGALPGYEPDPLAIGMAWTTTPDQAKEWDRIPENPVLSREQPDVRAFEKRTLYKSTVIWDKTYAHKPWMVYHDGIVYHFYCAVGTEGRVIALATSKNLGHSK